MTTDTCYCKSDYRARFHKMYIIKKICHSVSQEIIQLYIVQTTITYRPQPRE